MKNNNRKQARVTRKVAKSRANKSEIVIKANKLVNPLENLKAFQSFKHEKFTCNLESYHCKDLDEETATWVFDLTKRNMMKIYEESKEGWKNKHKRKELMDRAARYIIARDSVTNQLVGFAHYRFDVDFGSDVLYCYELQLEENFRGVGMGRFMIQALELIGFINQMSKVVLTVFKHNDRGLNFYHKCRYETDETSPEDTLEEIFDYVILSKANTKQN